MKKLILTTTICLIFNIYTFADQNYVDSLIERLDSVEIEEKLMLLNSISWALHINDASKAREYANQALELSVKYKNKKEEAYAYNNFGGIYFSLGNYKLALLNYLKALNIREEINDTLGIAMSLGNIGIIHLYLGNYEKARENYFKSLKIFKKENDISGIASAYINIGNIYRVEGDMNMALKYYKKSLVIRKLIDEKREIATSINNIAGIYYYLNNIDSALFYFNKALIIYEKLEDNGGLAMVLGNIGEMYNKKGNYSKALEYHKRSLEIAIEIGDLFNIENGYKNFSVIYTNLNDYKNAYKYYQLYSEIKDSLFNEESSKQIAEMQTKYETEKKEKEIALLNKEKKLQNVELAKKQAEVKKKNIQRNAFIGGFAMVLVLALVVYRGYRQKKKSNQILSEKNILITQQKAELNQTLEELRSTQEQLVESEKMASLGNLVAGVAHEINTPVGIGITASSSLVEETKQFAELYKKDKMNRKALEEYLENTFQASELILKNMNRTGELVQSFKQVSVDQMVDEKRKFNLKSYLNDIMLGIKPEFGKKKIKIDIDCDENLEINIYPGVFAKIITNLTLNSIRHGFREKNEGKIKITIRQTAPSGQTDNLNLQYSDNGIGISKENLPKIFDPFFTTNKQIGTGLGLHIVYNLVTQKLKGTVNCESESGNGVLFTIDIPFNE